MCCFGLLYAACHSSTRREGAGTWVAPEVHVRGSLLGYWRLCGWQAAWFWGTLAGRLVKSLAAPLITHAVQALPVPICSALHPASPTHPTLPPRPQSSCCWPTAGSRWT